MILNNQPLNSLKYVECVSLTAQLSTSTNVLFEHSTKVEDIKTANTVDNTLNVAILTYNNTLQKNISSSTLQLH